MDERIKIIGDTLAKINDREDFQDEWTSAVEILQELLSKGYGVAKVIAVQPAVIKSVCACGAPMHKFGTADLDTCINCNKPIK